MRILIPLMVFGLVNCASIPKEAKKPISESNPITHELLQKTIKVIDNKHNGLTFFRPHRLNGSMFVKKVDLKPYVGISEKPNSLPYFKLDTTYYGSNWIFFKEISFLCEGPKKFQEKYKGTIFGVDRGASGGKVTENVHLNISKSQLRKIGSCEKLSVRLSGKKYYAEQVLNKSEKEDRKFFDAIAELLFLEKDLRSDKKFLKWHKTKSRNIASKKKN